jgi:glycosyltransferase involved in cell wall biosynthesis
MPPKLSIVTPSFNQGKFLEETILSVLNQHYEPLEYIVIDGGSSDESVEIIRRYEKHLAYWISEKDRGQVHAINKGLARATGDIFAYINSDDLYLPGAFAAAVDYFNANPGTEWLCGDTVFFSQTLAAAEAIRTVVPRSAAQALAWAYKAPQPGMFWQRQLLDGFQEQWRYCFDHELYVRLLLAGHECRHLPVTVAAYRLHPDSKTVAEGDLFDREFDSIAHIYEKRLEASGQRWCKATRFLRLSYAASEAGKRAESARWLMRALATHPESLAQRPFWGCLRKLASNGADSGAP